MDPTQGFVTEFAGFVDDLTTPEKRNIVALTEIAREAMHNQPQAVPGLAQVIINRVLHVSGVQGETQATVQCLRW